MPFRDVVGHRRLVSLLARALARDTLPPALLLAGPAGAGSAQPQPAPLETAQAHASCPEPIGHRQCLRRCTPANLILLPCMAVGAKAMPACREREVGLCETLTMAADLGVQRGDDAELGTNPSVTLGGTETTPLMMANAPAGAVSMRHDLRGPSYGTVSACAAGAHAIGSALRMIQSGETDAVVCGGIYK